MLEASPLPKLPVVGFDPVEGPQRPFRLMLDHQTKEDELVNGTNVNIKYNVNFGRYPFVLMLDSIVSIKFYPIFHYCSSFFNLFGFFYNVKLETTKTANLGVA